jgi:hypothetical protein
VSRRPPLAAVLLLLLPLATCVSASYVRRCIDEPVPAAALQGLRPGASTLHECLERLGAPTQVFEYRGDGMALLWSWLDSREWGGSVSAPVADRVSANLDLEYGDDARVGCMLWFDSGLVLERWQQGPIGVLLPRRTRPAAGG